MKVDDIRREYKRGALRRKSLPDAPLVLFEQWLADAKESNILDPTAMSLATVDSSGQPYQRIVLLKAYSEDGFSFFSNLKSRKAEHIENNKKVSLLFVWPELERQIAITGTASKLDSKTVLNYFISRPPSSQIAAWVSEQSKKISARQVLEAKFMEMKLKFSKGEIPVPSFWGGYMVKPASIEFWQGGENRLHDRFLYTKVANDNEAVWEIERLAP